jgi:hypothetical protein
VSGGSIALPPAFFPVHNFFSITPNLVLHSMWPVYGDWWCHW